MAAQTPRPAPAFHENPPAAYRIQIPPGWQAVPNDEVDFAMRDAQADLNLYVRVLEGPYGDDRDAFRTLADFFKSDLDYLVLRQGLKPMPALGREGWNFLMRRTGQPRVELVVIIPQTPNGESSIYYHLRLEAPVRRLDAIESEMDRLLLGFRNPVLWLILGGIVVMSLIAITPPLLRNIRRNPIKDMRDE